MTKTFVNSALPGAGWATSWDNPEFDYNQATLSLTNISAPMGQDHIAFSYPYSTSDSIFSSSYDSDFGYNATLRKSDHFWKFGEGKTMKVVEEYIKGTYNGHYASDKSKVQVLDMIDAIDDGVPFCRDNLIKYSSRFGKKDGMSKLDALKIIHYGVLLYHFAGFNNETQKSNYETF
ncbi:MAG: DUF3310 domain-containing protein [Nitrosarchaeum sp.]|nr:DUF3310 domain-containing protein [Nitrosarchaeum sp.]